MRRTCEFVLKCYQSSVSRGWGRGGGLKVHVRVMLGSKVSVMVHVINNGDVVTLEQRLHEEADRPDHAHTHKDPQEETIDHHGHILPVFNDLQRQREVTQ